MLKALLTVPMLRLTALFAAMILVAGCAVKQPEVGQARAPSGDIFDSRGAMALLEVKQKQAKGQRVWCVPFARTMSGVNIKGNAGTWWHSAKGKYERGHKPAVGAVMAFASTRSNPMGHVAVVSEVVGAREIRIDHANWVRNKVTLKQRVVDVSAKNDWSSVKVESVPGTLGRSNPIQGFIYPKH